MIDVLMPCQPNPYKKLWTSTEWLAGQRRWKDKNRLKRFEQYAFNKDNDATKRYPFNIITKEVLSD